MSVDRPPKSIVWKDRPKSRKVSKIQTVSTVHRTTRLEPPTEDTTSNTAPQSNDGDNADAVEEEQTQPEPTIQIQAVQPSEPPRRRPRLPWPYGSGLPGFGAYRKRSWHNSSDEEQEDDITRDETPALNEDAESPNIDHEHQAKGSGTELPELIKDDESSDDDIEHRGTGKMSSDPKSSKSTWHFDMCPKASSSESNPADNELIPNEATKTIRSTSLTSSKTSTTL